MLNMESADSRFQTDLSVDRENESNSNVFDNLSLTENEFESHVEYALHGKVVCRNNKFLNLKDCAISLIAVNSEYEQDSKDSWDIYTRYVQLYGLARLSCLKKQFVSNTVDVQLYQLSSNDVKALSEALMGNTQVTTLNLSGNKLDSTGCCYLSDLLKTNNVINRLQMSRCRINSSGAIELGKKLEKSVLESFDLSNNDIGRGGLQRILEALQTNRYLRVLDLSNNGIRSECVSDICMFMEMNETLEKFNLSGNFLNKDADLTRLTRTLGVLNQHLRELILRWNGLSGEKCANIFKNLIVKTEGLKLLDISWNNFRNVGEIIGLGIKKTTVLEHLDISNNPLTTNDMVMLLNSVVPPTSLRTLGITHALVNEELEKAISSAQLQIPTFDVRVRLYTKIKTEPADLQALYLQRIHFLGVDKPKKIKNKIDFGQTLLKMKNEGNLEPMKKTVFLSLFEKLNIKGGMEIIEDFIKVFKNSKKKIDVAVMLDKYLELYPNTKL